MCAKNGEREQTCEELGQQEAATFALNSARRMVMYLEAGAPQVLTLHTLSRLMTMLRKAYGFQDNQTLLAAAAAANVQVVGAGDGE